MELPDLRPDCERCAALCCVALFFDRGEAFPEDKAAEEPCRQLTAANGCRVYAGREDHGYRGCVRYDCHGAGQRVTQEFFGGANWRETPAKLGQMSAAFRGLARLHERLAVLVAAGKLALAPAEEEARQALVARLAAVDDAAAAARFQGGPEDRAVGAFLGALRSRVGAG